MNFNCPTCQTLLSGTPQQSNQIVECPTCRNKLRVPVVPIPVQPIPVTPAPPRAMPQHAAPIQAEYVNPPTAQHHPTKTAGNPAVRYAIVGGVVFVPLLMMMGGILYWASRPTPPKEIKRFIVTPTRSTNTGPDWDFGEEENLGGTTRSN